jgi:hypothetical protein
MKGVGAHIMFLGVEEGSSMVSSLGCKGGYMESESGFSILSGLFTTIIWTQVLVSISHVYRCKCVYPDKVVSILLVL